MPEQGSDLPDPVLDLLVAPGLEPLFYRPSLLGPDSAWYGHLPFANWIMHAVRPSLFVELGTHAGVSYSAFCDAVLTGHLPTRCLAVDSWEGDEHAGFYGESVFRDFSRFHDQRYGGFSRLLRCRFDRALDTLPDAGIDLLHIDGRHRLSDITEDFDSWLPKLSPRGVVLLHDTNVRERDFGVWRFWETQRTIYPSFEFLHGHGLGVLAVGAEAPAAVLALCGLSSTDAAARLRDRFSLAGERWETAYALIRRDRQIEQVAAEAHDAAGLQAHAASLDQQLADLHARLVEADRFLRAQALELGLARSELANARAARHEAMRRGEALARRADGEAESARRAAAEREAARADLAERSRQLAERTGELSARATAADHALAACIRDADLILAARTAERDAALASRTADRIAHADEMALLRGSFFWRLTAPLRFVLDGLRPGRTPADPVAPPPLPPPAAALARLPQAEPDAEPDAAPDADAEPQPIGELAWEPEPEAVIEPAADGCAALATTRTPARWRSIHRVLFVIGEPGTPGAIYRCVRNADACRAAGYETEVVDLLDVNPDNLGRADLLILWRAIMSPHVETMVHLAHQAGTRVGFDIDDLMTRPELARIEIIDGIRTIGTTEGETRNYFNAMLRTLLAADFCIATTEELAAEMRRQHEVVHVLPNSFDEATHRRARYARRHRTEAGGDGHPRVGYAGGTRTHQKDFALAAPGLARALKARPQARLVLFREAGNQRSLLQMDEFPELAEITAQIEWRDMVPLACLPAELARFDISLCPLEAGNPFCESKSELKYFEAALAGSVTLASPTGPYRRAMSDGVTGLFAVDDTQWEQKLLQLIDDPPLRARLARNAYHDVLWKFGPWRQAELAGGLLGALDPNPQGDAGSSPDAARRFELGLRRGAYLQRSLPEVPDSELLFSYDRLGEAEVTVVMTSYNYEQHILEALDSVLAQTLEELDLAVVDDGSTDQSVPLVIEWAKRHCDRFNRIRILRTRANAGLGGARNVVFDAAETPWLMALDSDNRLLPEACATLLDALREVPQAAFAYPRLQQFGASDIVMGEQPFDPARLQGGNYIDAMAMVSKWAWAAAGGYYVRRDAMGWEDFDLWLNLVELGQFGVAVPDILAEYRVHQSSMVNAITEQSANKRAMVALVEARHPWLRLRSRDATPRGTPLPEAPPSA